MPWTQSVLNRAPRIRRCLLMCVSAALLLVFAPAPLARADFGIDWQTYAGAGIAGFRGDGGPANTAHLNYPRTLAIGPTGDLYIADSNNSRIRVVRQETGIITTIAGDGRNRFRGDGDAATSASLNIPRGLAVASDGTVYIADTFNNRIRKITPAGIISTVAGSGVGGYAGDGGPAILARLHSPQAVAVRADGALVIADTVNNRIRLVTPSGTISTIAGLGPSGYDGDGGRPSIAYLNGPRSVAIDEDGQTIYFSDAGNNAVRYFTPGGIIRTLAGTGTRGYSGDGGPATEAQLANPAGLSIAAFDEYPYTGIFIADASNDRIRVVLGSRIFTYAGATNSIGRGGNRVLEGPQSVVGDEYHVVIADTAHNQVIAERGSSIT